MRVSGCFYCGTSESELRPYGPDGAPICFRCMKAAPEREAHAFRVFERAVRAAAAQSDDGYVVLDEDGGPMQLHPRSKA